MKITSIDLKAVAVDKKQYPYDNLPEIALAGRSNVGKSSLINALIGRKSFARVSSEPGKTRTINFYNVNEAFYIVDLPGYGYAKVTDAEKEKWHSMIEEYLKTRDQLTAVILIVDIRHEPSKDDIQMFRWLKYYDYNTIVVCTKSDKLPKMQVKKQLEIIRRFFGLTEDDIVLPFSAETKNGLEELWKAIGIYIKDDEMI